MCSETRRLWEKLYPGEPFFLHYDKDDSFNENYSNVDNHLQVHYSKPTKHGLLLDGFDLYGSALRQATFLWQVSSPAFGHDDFLQDAVVNYSRFLSLKKHCTTDTDTDVVGNNNQKQVTIVVPTYQIDLMWHTHMLADCDGAAYRKDCRRILGNKTLHHDDSLNDRSEGSDLNVAFDATKRMWWKVYGKEYFVRGGMYRGEPPAGYYRADWKASHIICNGDSDSALAVIGNAHLVGKAGASSSTSRPASSENYRWITPGETSSMGNKPGFIPMTDKSAQVGVNANERKEDYIFGDEAAGVGYYHIHTKEAYVIAIKRLEKRVKNNKSFLCLTLVFFVPFGIFALCIYCNLKKNRDMLNAMMERREAPTPPSAVPGVVEHYRTSKGDGSGNNMYTTEECWAAVRCENCCYQ